MLICQKAKKLLPAVLQGRHGRTRLNTGSGAPNNGSGVPNIGSGVPNIGSGVLKTGRSALNNGSSALKPTEKMPINF